MHGVTWIFKTLAANSSEFAFDEEANNAAKLLEDFCYQSSPKIRSF
jgi:hypothetical protein